jgi:hypothetical protein
MAPARCTAHVRLLVSLKIHDRLPSVHGDADHRLVDMAM